MTHYNSVPARVVGRGTIKVSPTRTKRPAAHYSRLERYRATILCPSTWDALMADDSALGTHPAEGEGIRW